MMSTDQNLLQQIENISDSAKALAAQADAILSETQQQIDLISTSQTPFIFLFTAFVLACFIGYYVVWSVTPALHSPLMGVTNAISSVIIVGALIAAGPDTKTIASWFGFIAVILASVNIFGGFIVTHRMLHMFKKKPKDLNHH
ncbi:MAG: NAD(P) transhydrogenase subunit alpha [Pseudomonadota bacterium]